MCAGAATRDLRVQLRNAVEGVGAGAVALRNRVQSVGEGGEPEDAGPALPGALARQVTHHTRSLRETAYRTRKRDDRPCAERRTAQTEGLVGEWDVDVRRDPAPEVAAYQDCLNAL